MGSYKSAIDWMNEYAPFMVTPIINLGAPRYNRSIPTAQVEPDHNGEVFLSVNPDFFDNHSDSECAGILTHELYHIIFNHLAEFDKFENAQARIIAQECIVNDSVLEEGMDLPTEIGLCFGMDYVEYNASFLPTKIVYDDLMKNPEKLPEEMQVACSHGEEKGLDPRDAFQKAFGGVDLEEASESMKSVLEDAAKKAGSDFSFKQATQTGKKISLKWAGLINKIHPKTFTEGGKSKARSTWSRPRRKLAGMTERIMLPDRESKNEAGMGGNKRPKIVLALDTSGSIPFEKVQELMDLSQTIPSKKVEVVCCTFSTYPVEFNFNVKPEDQQIAHGGTDFSAITQFMKDKNLNSKVPVIVITDGYAGFYQDYPPSNLDNDWHWLVFRDGHMQENRVTKNIEVYEDFVG